MHKKPLFLIHPDYHPEKSAHAQLLLSVTENNFMYAITDDRTGEVWALYADLHCENVKEALQHQFETDEYLQASFQSMKASIFTEVEMLIPAALYQPNFAEDLPGLSQYAASLIANQPVADLVPVFSAATLDEINGKHPIDAYHPVLPMLKSAAQDGLYLNFSTHSVHFLYVHSGKVIYQNNYAIATAEEFNYYLLLIVQLLHIDPLHTEVVIAGIINSEDPMHGCLEKYFNKISFLSGSTMEDGILSNFPSHYFSALLALRLCA